MVTYDRSEGGRHIDHTRWRRARPVVISWHWWGAPYIVGVYASLDAAECGARRGEPRPHVAAMIGPDDDLAVVARRALERAGSTRAGGGRLDIAEPDEEVHWYDDI